MEYTPVEWHTGDIITEEKLNSMVSGITEGISEILVANITENAGVFTLDKTYKQIKESKFTIFKMGNESHCSVISMYETYPDRSGNTFYVSIPAGQAGVLILSTDNENGYPSGTIAQNNP